MCFSIYRFQNRKTGHAYTGFTTLSPLENLEKYFNQLLHRRNSTQERFPAEVWEYSWQANAVLRNQFLIMFRDQADGKEQAGNVHVTHTQSRIISALLSYSLEDFDYSILYHGEDALSKENDFINQHRELTYNYYAGGGYPPGEDSLRAKIQEHKHNGTGKRDRRFQLGKKYNLQEIHADYFEPKGIHCWLKGDVFYRYSFYGPFDSSCVRFVPDQNGCVAIPDQDGEMFKVYTAGYEHPDYPMTHWDPEQKDYIELGKFEEKFKWRTNPEIQQNTTEAPL